MALTSVVVFDFFICCRENGNKQKEMSLEARRGVRERTLKERGYRCLNAWAEIGSSGFGAQCAGGCRKE